MKAVCKDAGPHRQYEVGKIYDYTVSGEVCVVEGALDVSVKNFPAFFDKVEDTDGQKES